MADIDSIIAGGGKTNADFTQIGNLNKSYWEGLDQNQKQKARDVFSDGIPTNQDGSPDYAAAAKKLYQIGDVDKGNALSNLDIQRRQQRLGEQDAATAFPSAGNPASVQPNFPPSTSRQTSAVVAPPTGEAQSPPPKQGGQNLMQLVAGTGISNDQLGAATASVAKQIGISDPSQPLNLDDPQVRNVLVPALQRIKQLAPQAGQVVPDQAAPQGQPQPQQVAQQPPQQAQPQQQPAPPAPAPQQMTGTPMSSDPTLGGLVPAGRTPQQQLDFLSRASTRATPAQAKVYEQHIKAIQDALQPTTEMKNFAAAQANPGMGEYQNQQEAEKASGVERAKADVKEQQQYIDSGKASSQRLTTLNAISNIVNSDKNLTLGFGGETALKLKMAAKQLGVDVGDLSGAQGIQKLNASLASEMAKSLSARSTQFEFKTFLANNPGLLLDKEGNQRIIGIFSQLAKREVDLGKLARQNGDNWKNWDNVVEAYDKQSPIIDPVSKRPISTNSVISPGPSKQTGGLQTFNSAADVHAANLPKGTRFKDSNGVERMVP